MAQPVSPWGLAAAQDGSVFQTYSKCPLVWRLDSAGSWQSVAGTTKGDSGDGGLATAAQLDYPQGISVTRTGDILVADILRNKVREIFADGTIATPIGGNGAPFSGSDAAPTAASVTAAKDVAFGPDGTIYVASTNRILKVASTAPGYAAGDFLLPSQDGVLAFGFNSRGRHNTTVNSLTGVTVYTFGYDANGLLATITDGDNNVTTIEHDATGQPQAIVAPGGQRTSLTVDANGYLATLTNPAAEQLVFSYAGEGLLHSLTDPKGYVHVFDYDANGRLIQDSNPAGGFVTLNPAPVTNGFEVTLTTALSRVFRYRVETLANLDDRRTHTGADGLITTLVRTQAGVTTVNYPDGSTLTATEVPDPRWSLKAPVLGSLTFKSPASLTFSLTNSFSASLSDPANPLSLTSETATTTINGRVYTTVYDAGQRRFTLTTPEGRVLTQTIDAQGRLAQEQLGDLLAVSYGYDAQGRLASITQGTGTDLRTLTVTYDPQYRPKTVTDTLNQTATLDYDVGDRVKTVTLPGSRLLGLAYDKNSNVATLTPPGQPAHLFDYSKVDLESLYTAPPVATEPSTTIYHYNADKDFTGADRPDGNTLVVMPDSAGRLSSVTTPRGTITLTYDATSGSLKTVTDPDGGMLTYGFDGPLLTSVTAAGAVPGSVGFTWNTDLQVASETLNSANSIAYTYDHDEFLKTAGTLSLSRYPQNGFISGSTLGNVTDAVTYNGFGEPATYTASYAGTAIFSQTYTRDGLGRIKTKTEMIAGTTDTYGYDYDDAGRLWHVTKNGTLMTTYGYDLNGNRLTKAGQFGTITSTYDAQDRLKQYGDATYTFGPAGDLKTRTQGTATTTYDYDGLGNLNTVVLDTGIRIDYVTDGQGRRVGKKINGTLVQGFVWRSQLQPAAELDGNGTLVSRFVYATRVNVPDYMVKGGQTYRIITDHLGSPRLVVTIATGTVAQQMAFDEFGNVILDTNPGFQPFGFAGGLYDYQTKLVRFGARDYDAEIGRWTLRDRIGFGGGGTNLYAYAQCDPLNLLDLTGEVTPGDIVARALAQMGYTSYARDIPNGAFRGGRFDLQGNLLPDGAGANKCSLWVTETLRSVGVVVPNAHGRPIHTTGPTAEDYADPNFEIPGLPVVPGPPQPGDIVAIAEPNPRLNDTGHVGIVVGPGATMSVVSGTGKVGITPFGFRKTESPTIRRYDSCPFCPGH